MPAPAVAVGQQLRPAGAPPPERPDHAPARPGRRSPGPAGRRPWPGSGTRPRREWTVTCSLRIVASPMPPSSSAYCSEPMRNIPTSSSRTAQARTWGRSRAVSAQVGGDPLAQAGQQAAEVLHAAKLLAVSVLAPAGVVEVLLAPRGVDARGLEVTELIPADPDVLPGRRNGEAADALQDGRVLDPVPVLVEVGEAAAPLHPPQSRVLSNRSAGAGGVWAECVAIRGLVMPPQTDASPGGCRVTRQSVWNLLVLRGRSNELLDLLRGILAQSVDPTLGAPHVVLELTAPARERALAAIQRPLAAALEPVELTRHAIQAASTCAPSPGPSRRPWRRRRSGSAPPAGPGGRRRRAGSRRCQRRGLRSAWPAGRPLGATRGAPRARRSRARRAPRRALRGRGAALGGVSLSGGGGLLGGSLSLRPSLCRHVRQSS